MQKPKVLIIVGPTASGKTSLSIKLAKQFNGEIVSADSRQVYRGLDIGTGKVTKEEMQSIPHHLLDVANPVDTYTVADFVRDGRKVVDEIVSRNKLPIIVGGTFLYIDALLGKISTPKVPPNDTFRAKLKLLTNDALFEMLKDKDPERAFTIDKDNKRRLVRALEIIDAIGVVPPIKSDESYDTLTLGIEISKEKLVENIHNRLVSRMQKGLIEEVADLHKNGLSYERLKELGIEYKYIAEYLEEHLSQEEMTTQIETKSWQYAKRQMTWLKRDRTIIWIESDDMNTINAHIETFLSKYTE
jgi:tRNA dimethylallyltransferase